MFQRTSITLRAQSYMFKHNEFDATVDNEASFYCSF